MIRRDYILRMIDEFFRLLARVKAQKKRGELREAEATLEEEARRLTGADLEAIGSFSETEILARLLRSGELHARREKAFMLARVLIEAADLEEEERSQSLRLKALNLILDTALRSEEAEWPSFVPSIDGLAESLKEVLTAQTQALLMQYFERSGQFAKAEDSLYAALELFPDSMALRQLGMSFYQRLLTRSRPAGCRAPKWRRGSQRYAERQVNERRPNLERGIEDLGASSANIRGVASDDRQMVNEGCSADKRVHYRQWAKAVLAELVFRVLNRPRFHLMSGAANSG